MKDAQDFHVCTAQMPYNGPEGVQRAISVKGKYWKAGDTINIWIDHECFTGKQMAMIRKYASDWLKGGHGYKGANLKFNFDCDRENSDVRIGNKFGGAWSLMGTDCLRAGKDQYTMNLAWLDPGTIRHEVGHTLNFGHIHKTPPELGGLDMKFEEVKKDLGPGTLNDWSDFQINHNVVWPYNAEDVDVHGELDVKSNLAYAQPGRWNEQGITIKQNSVLSKGDRKGAALAYPFPKSELENEDDGIDYRAAMKSMYKTNADYRDLNKRQCDGILKLLKEPVPRRMKIKERRKVVKAAINK